MKKILFSFCLFASIIIFGSCVSSKKVPYFQNIDSISLAASRGLYDARIMPKDMLTITVNTSDPAASAPFNLAVSKTVGTNGELSSGSNSLQGYLVDNNGNINFPSVGRIQVAGLTKPECEDLISEKIRPFLASSEIPIVTVRMASYRVTVTGEVGSPKVIPVSYEKLSIIEALAQAGDLTIYGRRDNILLIREDATGEKHHVRLNLNDANIINSPYYYLQQNDIVYVQPNKVKSGNSGLGAATSIWFTCISMLMSITTFVINLVK